MPPPLVENRLVGGMVGWGGAGGLGWGRACVPVARLDVLLADALDAQLERAFPEGVDMARVILLLCAK